LGVIRKLPETNGGAQMNSNCKYTAEDVSGALDVLESYIQSVLSETTDNQVDNTVNTQLREITKTIERLEKLKIPVPESLLTEKLNLLSLIVQPSISVELVNEVYNRLNVLLENITIILKISNKGDRAKLRRSKLPMTKHQILRECIINALREYNGSADRNSIIDHVGEQLKDKFLPGDLEWRDDWKCYVWQNRVCWELTDMRIAGVIKPKRQTGIWELDDSYMKKD
jgi:hypothetical protein